jgi:Rrf2 family protein
VRDLAKGLGIPRNYLSKILNQLVRAGVLVSSRGKRGGFQLSRSAHDITLLDVIAPFDRPDQRRLCLLGQSTCSDETPCAAHWRWRALGADVAEFFRDTTVAELLSGPPIAS